MWHLYSKMVKHSPPAPGHPSLQPSMPRLSGSKVCAAVLGRDARTVRAALLHNVCRLVTLNFHVLSHHMTQLMRTTRRWTVMITHLPSHSSWAVG